MTPYASTRDRFDKTACLARSSSPLRTTTYSDATRDFPASVKLRRVGGVVRAHHVSAIAPSEVRERFGGFVSAFRISFPGSRDFGSKRRVRVLAIGADALNLSERQHVDSVKGASNVDIFRGQNLYRPNRVLPSGTR